MTEKREHWKTTALGPSGVAPGTYDRPRLTVDQYGLVTDATSSITPSQTVIAQIIDLPGIPSPATGDLAIVLDNGAGEEEMYVWNDANVTLGSPFLKWRLLATTEMSPPRVNFRNEVVGIVNPTILGAALSPDAIIKSVSVTINTPYDVGVLYRVVEAGGTPVYASETEIDAQLPGIYTVELPDNNTKISAPYTLEVEFVGGPTVGSSLVYIEYIVQV